MAKRKHRRKKQNPKRREQKTQRRSFTQFTGLWNLIDQHGMKEAREILRKESRDQFDRLSRAGNWGAVYSGARFGIFFRIAFVILAVLIVAYISNAMVQRMSEKQLGFNSAWHWISLGCGAYFTIMFYYWAAIFLKDIRLFGLRRFIRASCTILIVATQTSYFRSFIFLILVVFAVFSGLVVFGITIANFWAVFPFLVPLSVGLLGVFAHWFQPPSILLLSASSQIAVKSSFALSIPLQGQRVVTLVPPELADADRTERITFLKDTFRTRNDAEWKNSMRALAAVSLMVVIDGRKVSDGVVTEAIEMLENGYAFKTFFVVGADNRSSVLSKLMRDAALPPDTRIMVLSEDDYASVVTNIMESRDSLPRCGRFVVETRRLRSMA
jgi:hypothetical protein